MISFNFKKLIQNNKWLILVVLFFILWKFFLIYTMWHGRNIVPEPDDSFIYIAHINSVIQCDSFLFCEGPYSLTNFSGYEHLTYRLFFGSIGKLLHITATQTYHLSFYLGIIFLVPTLLYFTKQLTKRRSLQILILLFLGLYNGAGSYHGFFWVVPTFFSTLLFFLIFSIVLNNKIKYWLFTLPILSLLAAFNHIVSIYACSIFVVYFILLTITSKKINWLLFKKIVIIILFSFLPYFYITSILNNNPYQVSNLATATDSSTPIISSDITTPSDALLNLFPGLFLFKTEYLNWLFPNILGVLLFISIIFPLVVFKKYKIVYIYLSALIFTLISTKSIHGVRSLIYLWPITFILYAYGIYYGFKFINTLMRLDKKVLKLIKMCFYLGILFFSISNLSYSYLSNQEMNVNDNIKIPTTELRNLLLATTNEQPYCQTTVLSIYPIHTPSTTHCATENTPSTNLFLTFVERINPSNLQKLIAKIKQREIPKSVTKIHDKIPDNFYFYRQSDDLLIYKRN